MKALFFSQPGLFLKEGGGSASGSHLVRVAPRQSPHSHDTFIALSAGENNPQSDWAACPDVIPRRCPLCERDSIVGHGRRRKQAHDENHDWIGIRRGYCKPCKQSFTFLPRFSLPYTHYSLLARSQALRRRFVEGNSWEAAAPVVKDPDRVADPSTLRRWFLKLDSSHPPFSYLRGTVVNVSQWLMRGEAVSHGSLRLTWPTLAPFLHQLWPLRL